MKPKPKRSGKAGIIDAKYEFSFADAMKLPPYAINVTFDNAAFDQRVRESLLRILKNNP